MDECKKRRKSVGDVHGQYRKTVRSNRLKIIPGPLEEDSNDSAGIVWDGLRADKRVRSKTDKLSDNERTKRDYNTWVEEFRSLKKKTRIIH